MVDAFEIHVSQTDDRVRTSGLCLGQGGVQRGVGKGGAGCGKGAQRHSEDLLSPHHDMLETRCVGVDERTMFLGEVRPGFEWLDNVAIGIDHRRGNVHAVTHDL